MPLRTRGRVVWTGEFHVRAATRIVDLGLAPEIPSFFDLTQSVDRSEKLRFLHEFRDDVTKPIERDGLVHVNYVPTQVITEYLRRAFQTDAEGEPVFGLQLASSRDAAGHNVVVFLDNEHCVDPEEDPWDRAGSGATQAQFAGGRGDLRRGPGCR